MKNKNTVPPPLRYGAGFQPAIFKIFDLFRPVLNRHKLKCELSLTSLEPVSSETDKKIKAKKMKAIKETIIYTSKNPAMYKISKRAWAEYFEMERKLIRQRFVIRMFTTLLMGTIIGLILDKI